MHDRHRFVLHIDQVKRVLGNVAVIRHYQRNRFTDVAYRVSRQGKLRARLRQGSMWHQQRRGFQYFAQVLRSQHKMHTR